MSNQPPPSRPWLRLASIARPTAPPAPTPAPPLLSAAPTPAPPPVVAPPLRPVVPLPAFVRPAAPEPTTRPTLPAPAPYTLPGITPTPETQTQIPVLVPQQPAALPSENITPPPPVPLVETLAPPSPTVVAPPIASTASVPSTPILKSFAPSASLPTSPAKKLSPRPLPPPPAATSPPRTKLSSPKPAPPSVFAPISDTKPSPKIIKPEAETPPRSPALKPVAPPPPSPLKLPPPQIKSPDKDVRPRIPLEVEQKNVLFQKTVVTLPERENGNRELIRSVGAQNSGTAPPTVKGPNDVIASTGTGNGIAKSKVESKDIEVKVIMIAGENRGATMELTRSAKNQPYKIGNHARNSSGSSSDEGKHGRENQGHKGKAPATASPPTAAYTNSNVQGVNNSILYNSSCTHRDPGVHLSLTRKPAEGVFPRMKERKA